MRPTSDRAVVTKKSGCPSVNCHRANARRSCVSACGEMPEYMSVSNEGRATVAAFDQKPRFASHASSELFESVITANFLSDIFISSARMNAVAEADVSPAIDITRVPRSSSFASLSNSEFDTVFVAINTHIRRKLGPGGVIRRCFPAVESILPYFCTVCRVRPAYL